MKAIIQAHVKTDKFNAATLASLQAAGYLPQIWTPDAETERKRRLVSRRDQVARHRTRFNEAHSISHAHLVPKCPHVDLSNAPSRAWLAGRQLTDDKRATIDRHVRELDRSTGWRFGAPPVSSWMRLTSAYTWLASPTLTYSPSFLGQDQLLVLVVCDADSSFASILTQLSLCAQYGAFGPSLIRSSQCSIITRRAASNAMYSLSPIVSVYWSLVILHPFYRVYLD